MRLTTIRENHTDTIKVQITVTRSDLDELMQEPRHSFVRRLHDAMTLPNLSIADQLLFLAQLAQVLERNEAQRRAERVAEAATRIDPETVRKIVDGEA